MQPFPDPLSTARSLMTYGEVGDAAALLGHLWASLSPESTTHEVDRLRTTTIELADRFPLAPEVSAALHCAMLTYAQVGAHDTAELMAERMLSVWRARCQSRLTPESLDGHLFALDALASVQRTRGNTAGVARCLVELMEWQRAAGNALGVAWAERELGVLAYQAGNWTDAITRLSRAEATYNEAIAEALTTPTSTSTPTFTSTPNPDSGLAATAASITASTAASNPDADADAANDADAGNGPNVGSDVEIDSGVDADAKSDLNVESDPDAGNDLDAGNAPGTEDGPNVGKDLDAANCLTVEGNPGAEGDPDAGNSPGVGGGSTAGNDPIAGGDPNAGGDPTAGDDPNAGNDPDVEASSRVSAGPVSAPSAAPDSSAGDNATTNSEVLPIAEERGTCRVLLGRARWRQGDLDGALRCFQAALGDLPEGGAAAEVARLVVAARAGRELPEPDLLQWGEFGISVWERAPDAIPDHWLSNGA